MVERSQSTCVVEVDDPEGEGVSTEIIPVVGVIVNLKPIITELRGIPAYKRMVEALGERATLALMSDTSDETESFDYFIDSIDADISEAEKKDFPWDNLADTFMYGSTLLNTHLENIGSYKKNKQIFDESGHYLRDQLDEFTFCVVSQANTRIDREQHQKAVEQSILERRNLGPSSGKTSRWRINRQSPFRV